MSAQQKQTQSTTVLSAQTLGMELPETFSMSVGCAIWVRALLQNCRQGTVGCKDRSEVAFSNKKPWKQKGTGRARAGSKRSPLWKGGGVTHGPQPRTRQLKVGKKTKLNVMFDLFATRLMQGRINVLDWNPSNDLPNTKEAFNALHNHNLINGTIVLFSSIHDHVVRNSFANIPQVRIVSFDSPNAFDVLSGKTWVVLQKDMDAFKEMVSQWS